MVAADTAPTSKPAPASTSSRNTRVVGALALVGLATLLVFAFVFSEPQRQVDESTNILTGQGDVVRMLYIHFPSILVAYTGFIVTAVGCAMVLWRDSVWWDTTAGAAAEVGVLFCGITLFTGSVWGRPTWNTWWEWGDVRIMTTLILFLVYVGYLALRRAITDPRIRRRRSAIVGLVGAINVPIVYKSVEWWENRTLHQKSSLAELRYEDLTLFTLVLGFVVFAMIAGWLVVHRFRIGWLEHQADTHGLDAAIVERRAQAPVGVQRAVSHPGLTEDSGTT